MYENGVVTIKDWQKGQAKHPIFGFGLLQNVDVFESIGVATIKNRTLLSTVTTPTDVPIAEVYDVYGNTFTLTGVDGTGSFYKNGTAIQSTLGIGWDLKIYKDYVWVRSSTTLSCYGPLSSGAAQWFGSVQTGYDSGYNGNMLVGQDDYLYVCNGNAVAKIEVTASGVDTVAPTLGGITTLTALDLKDGEYATCLEEYGTKIMVGTSSGSSYFDRGNRNNAKLYAWNRTLGTLGNPGLADLPIVFSENGFNAIKQHANKLYVSVGTQGNIYATDSTNYIKIATLPYSTTGVNYKSSVYPNAIGTSPQGNLLVGISADIRDGLSAPGLFEIDLNNPGYAVSYRTTTSNTVGTLKIGFIAPVSFNLLNIGWGNNASYGVDTTDSVMYTSYGGVIESPLVKVGGFNSKKTFQHIEWSLAEPLVTGQNLRISYRKNSKEDYTLIDTWTFATLGGVISFEDIAAVSDCEYVQLKIELDQADSTIFGSNINLISVRLW